MAIKTILLTREVDDSKSTAAILSLRGYSVLIGPIIRVVELPGSSIIEDNDFDVVIVTSKNVFKFINTDDFKDMKNIPMIVVGDSTMDAAKSAGFTNIFSVNGNVLSIIKHIREKFYLGTKFLYLRGYDITVNFDEYLVSSGYIIKEKIVYRIKYRKNLSLKYQSILSSNKIDCILFYSTATAKRFVSLTENENINGCFSESIACCISEKVAKECLHFNWKKVIFADYPNQDSLLEKLQSVL